MAKKLSAPERDLRRQALKPFHYLVRVSGSDLPFEGTLVMRISAFTLIEEVAYASRNLDHYRGSSRRRPFMDLVLRGCDWKENGRTRALREVRKEIRRTGRTWLLRG